MRLEAKVLLSIAGVLVLFIGGGYELTSRYQQDRIFESARNRAKDIIENVMDLRQWEAEESTRRGTTGAGHPNANAVRSTSTPGWYHWQTITEKEVRELKPGFELSAYQGIMRQRKPWVESEHGSGEDVYSYAEALVVKSYCLDCHEHDGWSAKVGEPVGVMAVRLGLEAEQSEVRSTSRFFFWSAAATIVITLVVLYLLIRLFILRPLGHLKEATDKVSSGDLSVRAHLHTGDELENFGNVFNRMLQSIEESHTRLRLVNRSLDEKLNQLGLANLELLEMNQLKSEFLANVSHELRNPLNSIVGFSDLLTASPEDAAGLSERQQRFVKNISTASQRLLELINELLDLAKLESGKMEVKLTRVSPMEVIESLRLMRADLLKPGTKLEVEVDGKVPVMVTDEDKLRRILDNLLTNAIKFTDEGGRVTLRARPDGSDVLFSVEDTGVGIAPENHEIIFEKFRQVDGSSTRRHAGAGLGLSIVKELTTLLGGSITLTSELGKGSTFTVRLPGELTEEKIVRRRPQAVWGQE